MARLHKSKQTENFLKDLAKAGFEIQDTGKHIKIYAPGRAELYIAHMSERAYHPLRRFAQKHGYTK